MNWTASIDGHLERESLPWSIMRTRRLQVLDRVEDDLGNGPSVSLSQAAGRRGLIPEVAAGGRTLQPR